jgi:hypothetical protein
MGYGKIGTSYAIEFDTNSNVESSDPKTPKKRHISIIRKEGDPNLVDTPGKNGHTIAWNDLPFNFNNPNEEGYIREAHVRIEYFAKMFRVYINDAIQVSLYDPPLFNENEEGQIQYVWIVGITASTGRQLQATHSIKNWRFFIPNSYAQQSDIKLVVPTDPLLLKNHLVAGTVAEIEIYIRDVCGNYYWIDPRLDVMDPAQPDDAYKRLKWES